MEKTIYVSAVDGKTPMGSLAPRKVNLKLKELFQREVELKLVNQRMKWAVRCANQAEVAFWQSMHLFLGIEIKVEVDEKFNLKMGVIHGQSLVSEDDRGLMEELSPFGAVKLKNFAKNGERGPTFLVYFFKELPKEVKVGYELFRVREFTPDPLRCFNCNVFGHSARNCRQSLKSCVNCGEKHSIETGVRCEKPSKCVNCGSADHNALSRACPAYQREKKIVSYASVVKQPVGEIKRQIKNGLQLPDSYSSVLKSNVASRLMNNTVQLVTTAMQTDSLDLLPPLELLPPGERIILKSKPPVDMEVAFSDNVDSDNEIHMTEQEKTQLLNSNPRQADEDNAEQVFDELDKISQGRSKVFQQVMNDTKKRLQTEVFSSPENSDVEKSKHKKPKQDDKKKGKGTEVKNRGRSSSRKQK